MAITNALASLAVKDLGASSKWYERLLERGADSVPMPEVAEWRFDSGGWLQVYQSADRVGRGSVTLAVDDLDEQIAKLGRLGIDVGKRMATVKVDVVMIKDPDGNSIAFAQAKDPTMAQ